MNWLTNLLIGLDGKNLYKTFGCFFLIAFAIGIGFWFLIGAALVKYLRS